MEKDKNKDKTKFANWKHVGTKKDDLSTFTQLMTGLSMPTPIEQDDIDSHLENKKKLLIRFIIAGIIGLFLIFTS